MPRDPVLTPLARTLAVAAMALLSVMVVITSLTGVSQEQFEVVRNVDEYRLAMMRGAPSLRLVLAADSLFVAVYSAFFVVLARLSVGRGIPILLRLGTLALLTTAVLDIVEDQHLFALATSFSEGETVSQATLRGQHLLSQSKFHLSYVGLFFFGLGLPRDNALERVFSLAIALPLPVLGAFIWIAPPALAPALDFARWFGFVGGFAGALALLREPAHPGALVTPASSTGAAL